MRESGRGEENNGAYGSVFRLHRSVCSFGDERKWRSSVGVDA